MLFHEKVWCLLVLNRLDLHRFFFAVSFHRPFCDDVPSDRIVWSRLGQPGRCCNDSYLKSVLRLSIKGFQYLILGQCARNDKDSRRPYPILDRKQTGKWGCFSARSCASQEIAIISSKLNSLRWNTREILTYVRKALSSRDLKTTIKSSLNRNTASLRTSEKKYIHTYTFWFDPLSKDLTLILIPTPFNPFHPDQILFTRLINCNDRGVIHLYVNDLPVWSNCSYQTIELFFFIFQLLKESI